MLTGSSSIAHALRCGARLGAVLGHRRPRWVHAAEHMLTAIVERPDAFAPKQRWAMDWYYPVLSGALGVSAGKARLADGWATFVMEGFGVRCVSDEPWVTASETAECAIALATIGDTDTASDLLRWTRTHRRDDGSYWTGIVYPEPGAAATACRLPVRRAHLVHRRRRHPRRRRDQRHRVRRRGSSPPTPSTDR